MPTFGQCFKQKLPWSLLLLPCVPCVGDNPFWKIYLIALSPLLFYFLLLLCYRNKSDWLQTNTLVPIYVVICFALVAMLATSVYLYQKQEKLKPRTRYSWFTYFLSSLPLGILLTTAGIVSTKIAGLLPYLPMYGSMLFSLYEWFSNKIGVNTVKILQGLWGSGLSAAAMLIPTFGPLITVILLLVPQNLILIWLLYVIMCASFNLG